MNRALNKCCYLSNRLVNDQSVIILIKLLLLRATALYAIARICCHNSVRLDVCLDVWPSHGWISQVEVRIMQFSPQGSPMTLVSSRSTSQQNSTGNLGSGGAK